MYKWKIIADSGCDIRHLEARQDQVAYAYIPLMLNIDHQVFIDDENLSLDLVQDKLSQSTRANSSACPPPDHYAKEFQGAENIICFTLSSNVSGSFNSANLAKQMLAESHPDINIHIVDTKSAGSEMNVQVRHAFDLAQKGLSFQEMVDQVDSYKTNTNYILKNVDNLVKNGRVNKILGQMIGLLNIHLVGKRSDDGHLELADKARGSKRAIRVLFKEIEKNGYQGGPVEISHALNPKLAEEIKSQFQSKYQPESIQVVEMSGLCSFYAEKDGIIVGYQVGKQG